MQKKFNILLIGMVMAGSALGFTGMALVSQAAPSEKGQNMDKPLPAADVKMVKKTVHPEIGEIKGKPAHSSRKNKNGGPAATGILGPMATGTKYAVVIGICDYPEGTNAYLCWSDGDSLNMYKVLTTLYGYDNPDNIYLFRDTNPDHPEITDGPATFENIKDAVLNKIKPNVKPEDEVVFFFSGHGADGIVPDGDKETRDEAIVVHDGTNLVYIWDGQLRDWFSDFGTSRIVFVFDSCLAGGMNDVADIGRVVSMATSETQVAYVFSRGNSPDDPGEDEPGEGVFSHYFVKEGMLDGLADVYDSIAGPDVTIEEAFDYAKEIIPSIWKRQNPTISDGFTNDLLP